MFDFYVTDCQLVTFDQKLMNRLIDGWPRHKPLYTWLKEERPEGRLELVCVTAPITEVLPAIEFIKTEKEWVEKLKGLLVQAGIEEPVREKFFEFLSVLELEKPWRYGWIYSDNAGPNNDRLVGFLGKNKTFLLTLSK